ncbi:hypothetical protein HY988_05375 [Candidatus Micrarchaeota archaeon]|nr:hypothetical protein [Candidatus Micrarchaeota archaeon]
MKGYISFALAFVSVLLLLSIVKLYSVSYDYNFHRAIEVERVVGLHENVQETSKELIRQGALVGFKDYDEKYDIKKCIYCIEDHICSPFPDPPPPVLCDPIKCRDCFRDYDAEAWSHDRAIKYFGKVKSPYNFDPDFSVDMGDPDIKVILDANGPYQRNGYRVNSIIFKTDFPIKIHSDKFNISSTSKIGEGVILESSGNN